MNTHTRSTASDAQGDSQSLILAYAACRELVEQFDPDRYVATLFAPAQARPHLFALYAFSSEIARVREMVSEALPGEMRHQWWREALSCKASERGQQHPVAIALLDTMHRFRLPPEPFLSLIEARGFDLYDDPMPTWQDLEGYCGETSSALIRLASLILAGGEEPGSAALCGHAGVCYALAGLARAFPVHARRGQCYVPHEVLFACNVRLEDIHSGNESEALRAALFSVRQRARSHLEILREGIRGIDHRIAPAFYPVSLVTPWLNQMERPDYRPFETLVTLSPFRRLMTLGQAAWKSRHASSR